MLRKILSLLAALALAAGFGVAVSGTASATSFTVTPGSYVGAGHQSGPVMVQFHYSHGSLSGVKVGNQGFGNGSVHNGAFNYCDHAGNCLRGQWYNAVYVGGEFKPSGHHTWTPFEALPRETPARGTYSGYNNPGFDTTVTFRAVDENGSFIVKDFRIAGRLIGNAHIGHAGHFDTSHGGTSFKGFWDSKHHVWGQYRLHGSSHWVTFEANQYSA